jgi:transcriptional regulator with XRE-family HTH domain
VIGPLPGNLRRLRARRGLTLGALAEESGIAKATLSNLERGIGNPTLETLFALARGLGFPLGDLLADEDVASLTLVRRDDTPVISGDAVDLRLLTRFAGGPSVTEIYDFTARQGKRQISLGHPGVENICVKQGVLRTGSVSAPVELQIGDFVSFAAQTEHFYEAVGGDVEAVLVLHYPSTESSPHPSLLKSHEAPRKARPSTRRNGAAKPTPAPKRVPAKRRAPG